MFEFYIKLVYGVLELSLKDYKKSINQDLHSKALKYLKENYPELLLRRRKKGGLL